ncbi:ribosome quality control complex subunit TCF25-like [Oscarella lobularis]|uniref:ribosome quality control complex subunit TCF25-like n=1 Tax=Oscarella lobularis TaxID=121494 RepID=UPI0033143F92
MSSRALKKLHRSDRSEPKDEEEVDALEPFKARSSAFALLDEESPVVAEAEDSPPDESIDQEKSAEDDAKKRKKKKKKKKQSKLKPVQEHNDIDAICREINAHPIRRNLSGDSVEKSISEGAMDTRTLLSVEHRNLNYNNEMRRIFGSSVVDSTNRRRGGGHRGGHRAYFVSSWLATPRDTWPQMMKLGLSMEMTERREGCQYFRFVHSSSYQKVQFEFLDAVESLDPENIAAVLRMYPYHIDSLLQLSEICKMTEDRQMAAELTERALYSFECSFHTLFSLTSGLCRLDYRYPENRSFFLALFRHAVSVGQKGCHRTALEFCKLLLSLDPNDDPLCVLLMIDVYALRAQDEKFLLRLASEWEPHRNLSQLPNWAFSVPLAMFNNEAQCEEADRLLQKALIMFPSVLKLLLDKCGVVIDSATMKHSYFATSSSDSPGLHQLESLFVARNHLAWRVPEVLAWLERNARVVCEQVDAQIPLVEECRKYRSLRYKGTPRNIYRHIIISDFSDATAFLPPEISHSPVMSFDPLPPKDSIVSYTRPERRRQSPLAIGNPFSLFLSSLMPSFDPEARNDAAAATPGPLAGFAQSMRELLAALGGHHGDEEGPDVNNID